MSKLKAYYARPISLFGSKQEERDKAAITDLGYAPIEINKKEIQAAVQKDGMKIFEPMVKSASALFFRAFADGSIGAGVYKEICWAQESGIVVMELPSMIARRALSVDETREMLRQVGYR